ncbi:MAG: DUF2652 domain-containing protein [Chloroflexota bacterium]
MTTGFHIQQAEGPLLLADIGGYTSFLQDVAVAHRDDAFAGGAVPEAYRLMSSLLDGIVSKVVPPFALAKLEGDAVFAIASARDEVPTGAALLDCLRACHDDFRARLAEVGEVWTCTCTACLRADALELKFILHSGAYVVQEIAGSREVIGPEVVMAHRLLKNHAAETLGSGAYALLTDAAVRRLGVPTDGAVPLTETYEHYAPISALVFAVG